MMHVPGIIASKTPLEMNRFRLSRNQAIEKELDRRWTQMRRDGKARTTKATTGTRAGMAWINFSARFLSACIGVDLRLK
jgi:hypothetical protein